MSNSARIQKIQFTNFKALSRYTLYLTEINILVGPNNSGKSTIVGALRTLDAAIRYARSRAPERLFVGELSLIGYRLPADSVPISLENVQSEYNGLESRIEFSLNNKNTLELIFPEDGGCVLLPRLDGGIVRNAASFRKEFPIDLIIVPVLGPVEHRERQLERSTVVGKLSTNRASRHFRNYWHMFPDGFNQFSSLIEKTWPGMIIKAPEVDTASGELSMFCLEERRTRELYWVGFGFQIWCQLLTHLSRASAHSLVVVDEPEVYLHPDVQRQLLGIVRDIGADVLVATHSSEIIAEADPAEIVMIDKKRRTGERLKNIAGVQKALQAVGSSQNITLTALAKSRRILFVEGMDDFKLLRRFARRNGMQELSSGTGIIPLASGGFGSWERLTILADGIAEALGAPLTIGAVYDRDYFCDEQIAEVENSLKARLSLASILARKEIENYLLLPSVLDRALNKIVSSNKSSRVPEGTSHQLLETITGAMHDIVLSQIIAKRNEYYKLSGKDQSTINLEVLSSFEKKWMILEQRLKLVSGKEVLRQLRQKVQDDFGATLTDARIIDAMHKEDLPEDLIVLLTDLNKFRVSNFRD